MSEPYLQTLLEKLELLYDVSVLLDHFFNCMDKFYYYYLTDNGNTNLDYAE